MTVQIPQPSNRKEMAKKSIPRAPENFPVDDNRPSLVGTYPSRREESQPCPCQSPNSQNIPPDCPDMKTLPSFCCRCRVLSPKFRNVKSSLECCCPCSIRRVMCRAVDKSRESRDGAINSKNQREPMSELQSRK